MRHAALGLLAVVVALVCWGCAVKAPLSTSPAESVLDSYDKDGDGNSQSLFRGDSAILSDAEITRILSFQLDLSGRHRLAVLKLGRTRYWSEDHAKIDQENLAAFLDRLRSAPGVAGVSQLPSLLVPEKKTVPHLREGAARYQADLLVVYETGVQTFTKYRNLGKDEVRALCTVEALLLDVRTGIVPFTTRKAEEVVAARAPDDFSFSETTARAVAAAEGRALRGVADETLAFLGKNR